MKKINKIAKNKPIHYGILLICIALLSFIWTIRLIDTHKNGYILSYVSINEKGSYHSDDAAQPNIVWAWQNGYRQGAVVGDDSWYLKFPIYLLTNNLSVPPAHKLFLNSWIVLMITAVGTISAYFTLIRTLKINNKRAIFSLLCATLLLAFLPAEAFGVIKMPNSRNIELAIYTWLILLLYLHLTKNKTYMKYKYKIIPIGIMITGLLFSDDPLFVYFGLLPILIAYFVLYFFGKFSIKELERFIIFALAACLISFMIKMLLKIVLPIQYFSHTTSIANIDVVLQTIKGFFDGGMGIFGIKLFGYTKLSIVFLQSLLFLGVYLIIATFFYINKNNKNEKLFVTVISFLFLIPFLIFFIGTKTAGGVASSRYLIMLVYIIPLISIWAIYNIKLKRQLVIYGLLVGMIVISSSYNIYLSTKDTNKANNALSYEIINLANTNGLNKGVARLWHSNITTYLSSFSQNVFTAGCRDEELVINNILFETAVLNKDANNSYYIYDSLSPELDKCSPTQLVRQLGEPIKTIELKSNPGVYMVIYNKDITKNIKLMTFGSNNE